MLDDILGQFFHWLGEALGIGRGRGPLILGGALLLVTICAMIVIVVTELL